MMSAPSAPRLDPPYATVQQRLVHYHNFYCCCCCRHMCVCVRVCVRARARSYATVLVPSLALAPAYMAGQVEFGVITQASDAQ